jgi:hypothetical protein
VTAGWWAAENLGYATRLSGTPGLFMIDHCETQHSGRGTTSTACYGSFHADDGRVFAAGPIGPRDRGETRQPMQYHDGKVTAVGAVSIAGWSCIVLFALAGLGAVPMMLVFATFAAWGAAGVNRLPKPVRATLASSPPLFIAKWSFLAALLAVAVYFVGNVSS